MYVPKNEELCQVHKWWTWFFSILFFIFIFFSFYFLIVIFLEHRVRIKSQDAENEVEGSRTNDIMQHGHHMLTSYPTHGHLE